MQFDNELGHKPDDETGVYSVRFDGWRIKLIGVFSTVSYIYIYAM